MKTMQTIYIAAMTVLAIMNTSAQEMQQTVRGQVTDRGTHVPLPGATIVLDGSDPLIGTITDPDGYFRLEKVPVGRQKLTISYTGYETLRVNEILVTSSKEVNLAIELSEAVHQMDDVVIKAYTQKDRPVNPMATLSARSFSVEEASRYAGGFDDPARLASSFAGITTGAMQDNSIVIRGNAPKGVLWRLEGVAIPNPNHFAGAFSAGGGFVTIFSSQMMGNSDFFTGAFPAEYGNAMAGVFDMNFKAPNNEKRESWVQLGLLGVDVGSEGPIVKNKKSSYLFNYRYSTYGLIQTLMPEGSGLPTYQDLSIKFNFPTRKAGSFSLWGIGAIDKMVKFENADSAKWEMKYDAEWEETHMMPGAAGITHKYLLSSNSYLNTTIAATNYSGGHEVKRLDESMVLQDLQHIDMNEQRIILHSYLNHKFGSRHTNRSGLIYNQLFYNIKLDESPKPGNPMQEFVNSNGTSYLLQAYSQSKIILAPKLTANIGVHAEYFGLNGHYSIEPRAGIRWDVNTLHSLSLGFGKHSQLEDLKIYLAENNGEPVNKNLDFSHSLHFVLGYDWTISEFMRLKIEPYYQYLYNIPVIDDSSYSMINFHQQWFMNDTLVNKGTGTNIGIDITFERFLHNGIFWLATASVFDSKYVGGDGIERNSAYNKGFVINALFGKEFYFNKNPKKPRILSLSGKLTYMGGERLTPILEDASIEAKDIIYDYTKAYEQKADPNMIANLTVQFRINKAKLSHVWALQVLNMFGTPTDHEDFYNYKENKIDVSTTSVIVPSIYYRIEF